MTSKSKFVSYTFFIYVYPKKKKNTFNAANKVSLVNLYLANKTDVEKSS